MKAKNQRLTLILLAAAAVFAAVLLAMSAMRDQASYFYAPGDVAAEGLPLDRRVRVGGMVKAGSLQQQPDGVSIRFLVGDETSATISVLYRGIPPELFREGSGMIAEGRFQPDGSFVASEILAKHDENYMPSEISKAGERHKAESLQ